MPLRDTQGRSIVAIAGLAVAVTGGALVGSYSVRGMNPIYTQSRNQSILADNAGSGIDMVGARPAAYGVADPADEPHAFLSVPRDPYPAEPPGM